MNVKNQTKIFIEHDGERLSLKAVSARSGIGYATLRLRFYAGARTWTDLTRKPLPTGPSGPPEADRRQAEPTAPYTREELFALYRGFAGQPDELTRLADFAGTGSKETAGLLREFRRRMYA